MRGGELNVVEDDDSSKGKEKEKELSLQCWLKCKTRFLIVRAREKYRSNRCFYSFLQHHMLMNVCARVLNLLLLFSCFYCCCLQRREKKRQPESTTT